MHCNINRTCEVEDAVPEWQRPETKKMPKIAIDVSKYANRFKVLSV